MAARMKLVLLGAIDWGLRTKADENGLNTGKAEPEGVSSIDPLFWSTLAGCWVGCSMVPDD